jgi:hypothetical protein
MQKDYIHWWKRDAVPNDNRSVYHFSELAEEAYPWPTRELAEIECLELNRGVTIPEGGTYVCKNFQVEEDAPDRFVIYCEAPFKSVEATAASR